MRRRTPGPVSLRVDDGPELPLELAVTNRQRRRGLLGRSGIDGAIWFEPCRQVHTFRMRFPIDVAYVDRAGRVVLTRTLPRGRIGPLSLRTRSIIEAEAGAFWRWGLAEGSRVQVLDEAGRA